jgi:hypothetical protein
VEGGKYCGKRMLPDYSGKRAGKKKIKSIPAFPRGSIFQQGDRIR